MKNALAAGEEQKKRLSHVEVKATSNLLSSVRQEGKVAIKNHVTPLSKQELLSALASVLGQMAPGAAPPAAFESPKVAAHGDLATTAAMPLARSLKKIPREIAQQLVELLAATPAARRWVQGFEAAGPGFVNLRLAPAAKQAVRRFKEYVRDEYSRIVSLPEAPAPPADRAAAESSSRSAARASGAAPRGSPRARRPGRAVRSG